MRQQGIARWIKITNFAEISNHMKISHFILVFLCLIFCISCGQSSTNITDAQLEEKEKTGILNIQDSISIFGIQSLKDPISILKALSDNGIIKTENLKIENDTLKGGVIYFNGVSFGINLLYNPKYGFESLGFISSLSDEDSYNLVKNGISKYYEEGEETEWHRCYWKNDTINIRIRPLHTEDGGLVMFWEF